jgi:Uma2 family endonuclease
MTSLPQAKLATVAEEIVYPDRDDEPLAETDVHLTAILYLLGALRTFFYALGNVYIAADMFLYYQEGKPAARLAPDVMVIKGVKTHKRRSFKTWVEQARPCTIIEVTSEETRAKDEGDKQETYARLGIPEYLLFDPLGEYLTPRFQVFQLVNASYHRATLDSDGGWFSPELGVRFLPVCELLRVLDPATGEPILTQEEANLRAWQEAERAEQEAQRAQQEAERAEQETLRAEQESARAEQEAQRATAAEAEVARLQALLAQLQSKTDAHEEP